MTKPRPKVGERQYRAAEFEKDTRTRTIRFVASDESVDRYGDIIRIAGWQLDAFERNPVLLWAHLSREPPIGNARAWIEGLRLMADATFATAEESAFADQIWRLVDAGVIRAVSVGFAPTEMPNWLYDVPNPGPNDWPSGLEFIGQELHELSVVSVPANANALAVARSLGIPEETNRQVFNVGARDVALAAAEHRRRSVSLARLRAGLR